MGHFSYLGLDEAKIRYPDDYNIHSLEVYHGRIKNLLTKGTMGEFPITLTLWQDGHWCTEHDECASGRCSDSLVCSKSSALEPASLYPGAGCTFNSQCASGVCHLNKCALPNGLVGDGSPCAGHTECDSQRCADGQCLPKAWTGNWCQENADCESDDCSGPRNWMGKQKCQP